MLKKIIFIILLINMPIDKAISYQDQEQVLPEAKPFYAEDSFLNYMEEVENPNLSHGIIHKSAEGGNDTMAFGHKLTDEEIENNEVYGYKLDDITPENANSISKHILILDLQKADEKLKEDYGEKYTNLDNERKQMLLDFQYNMGSGGLKKFSQFKEGIFSNDTDKMKQEYERGFTDQDGEFKKLKDRNLKFFKQFLVDKE